MIVERRPTPAPCAATGPRDRNWRVAEFLSRIGRVRAEQRLRLIAVTMLGLATLAIPTVASGYVQRAVDRLLETKECIRCDLRNADLRDRDLRRAKLTGAYLVGAKLGGADLAEADLSGAHMADADLAGASLERTDLTGADLSRVNFTLAHLHRALLVRARLSGAPLVNADLREAKLDGARLQGANLRGAKGLSQAQIRRACGDRATVLPEGLRLTVCTEPVRKNRDND